MTNHETSTGRKDGWMDGWVNVEQRKRIIINHLFSFGMGELEVKGGIRES